MNTVHLTPAVMPFGYGKGYPSTKILTDGTKFYCAGDTDAGTPCPDEYVGDSFGQVMAHRSGGHGARKARNTQRRAQRQPVEQALADIKARAQALIQDVDNVEVRLHEAKDNGKVPAEWKERALKAERSLSTLRRALGA